MKRVLILLPKAFEVYECAAFVDVLGWARDYGPEPIEAVTAGLTPETTCTFGAFEVRPNLLVSQVVPSKFDAVAIPGGFESEGFFEEAYADPVLEILRQFDAVNKPVASICVGALPLAKSGILNGQPATTYHLKDGLRREQLKELGSEVVDAPIVVAGNKITSTSPATAVEVALLLVEKLTSIENADHISQLMGFTERAHRGLWS